MNQKIGPSMRRVALYVKANPGCTKTSAGQFAFGKPCRNMAYIHNPVNRAIRAKLITATKVGNRYALAVA